MKTTAYALLVAPPTGEPSVEYFDSPYTMSRKDKAYTAGGSKTTPYIDGIACASYVNANGFPSYTKRAN